MLRILTVQADAVMILHADCMKNRTAIFRDDSFYPISVYPAAAPPAERPGEFLLGSRVFPGTYKKGGCPARASALCIRLSAGSGFERPLRGIVEQPAGVVEAGTMAGAVPGSFIPVPLQHAAHMGADGPDGMEDILIVFIHPDPFAADGDHLPLPSPDRGGGGVRQMKVRPDQASHHVAAFDEKERGIIRIPDHYREYML